MTDKVNVAALAKLARLEVSDRNPTPREIDGVRKAQREVRRGEFASDRKVKSFFAHFRV